MTAGLRQAAVLTTTLMMVVGIGARSSGAQATDPTVTIDRTGTAAGETLLVTGSGWTNGASLIVELCGHGGLRGTVDCDVPHQRTAGVGPSGTFSVELTSGVPPAPCPCVVKATDQTSQIAATAAIAVAGVPTVAITDVDQGPVRTIEISSLEITGGGRWFELFGAGARRTLEITLVNTGAVAVDSPDLSIAWGSGRAPSGFVEPPNVERMAPGDTQTVTVRLDTPAFAIGERTAVVEIQGLGEPVVARTSTTSYPWGLLVLGLVALQLVLLRLRNRLRRRVQRRAVEPPAPREAEAEEHEVLARAAAEPEEPDHVSTMDVIDLDALEIAEEPAEPTEVLAIDLSANEQKGEEPAEAAVVTLDLAEIERSDETPAASEAADAAVASNGSADRVEDGRVAAERALQRAEAEAEAMVAAARDRLADLEAQAPARLEEADARCERDLELLDAVWRRAEALAKASQAAVAATREQIEAEHTAAEQAVAEAEAARTSLVEGAQRELARILESLERDSRAAAEAAPGKGASAPRPPRADELDRRLARAVERALASMGPDTSH